MKFKGSMINLKSKKLSFKIILKFKNLKKNENLSLRFIN